MEKTVRSPSALKKTVRARFGAASAFKAAVPGSLFENAGLGYTVLSAAVLHSALFVHAYARVHTVYSHQVVCKTPYANFR